MYICAVHACLVPAKVRKRVLDLLELKFMGGVRYHTGVGN